MPSSSSCNICCKDRIAENKMVRCPSCGYGGACIACQKQYGRASCMQCREVFDRPFTRSTFGAEFYKSVLLPELRDQEIAVQRAALGQVQAIVDWETNKAGVLSRRRFGSKEKIPEKPEFAVKGDHVGRPIACPGSECRGFVVLKFGEPSACGTCKKRVCDQCREFSEGQEGHVCDPSTLQSIKAISDDTKPCPSCNTPIHKTQGCDHMHCTNCGVHFGWRHLRVLKTSTNHHYNSGNQARNRPVCGEGLAETDIPREVYRGPPESLKWVYDDLSYMRSLKSHAFDEAKITAKSNSAIVKAGVAFLEKKIDEKKWRDRIVRAYEQREADLSCAMLVDIVVDELRRAQSDLHSKKDAAERVKERVRAAFEMAGANLNDVRDTFGGIPNAKFRAPDAFDAHPMTLG